MFYGIDMLYIVLVVPAIIFAMLASSNVSRTFDKYNKQKSASGKTGAEIARRMLAENGLEHVSVMQVSGKLSDHYDPRSTTVNLSSEVYNGTSVASLGVAAHEVGHAIQHSTNYSFLTLRNMVIPITNIGSKLYVPIIFIGLLLNHTSLMWAGIILFATVAAFQLITLPVEFNASARALQTLDSYGILSSNELSGTKKVLTAAAMTYVAALVVTLMQLLRYVLIARRRN